MTAADPPSSSSARVERRAGPLAQRRNAILFVVDTGGFFFALSLIDMSSVMPLFLGHLTSLPVFIGIIGSVQTACWLLPQLLVARVVASRRRKLPIVLVSTTVSRLSWIILFGALLYPGSLAPWILLVAAYVSMGLFWLLDGVAVLAWYDVIARAVPATLRGRMFGLMSLSGVFAIVGGLVVQRVLGNPEFPFPADYRLLLGLAIVVMLLGVIPLYLVREPRLDGPLPITEPIGTYLRRLPALARDRPSFRRLASIQLLIGMTGLAVPFYAPYGVLSLGLPESSIGTFVVGLTVGSILGGFAWGYLADHRRQDLAIRAITVLALMAPSVALTLKLFGSIVPAAAVTPILTVALFCVGCSNRSSWVAYANYIMEIAEAQERPILIGLMNTLTGSLAVMPPLGGLLAGWFGYEATFLAAMFPAVGALALSLGLRIENAATGRGGS